MSILDNACRRHRIPHTLFHLGILCRYVSRSPRSVDSPREGLCIPFRREYISRVLLSRRQYSARGFQSGYVLHQSKRRWSDAPVRSFNNKAAAIKRFRRPRYSLSETNPQPLPYCCKKVRKRSWELWQGRCPERYFRSNAEEMLFDQVLFFFIWKVGVVPLFHVRQAIAKRTIAGDLAV